MGCLWHCPRVSRPEVRLPSKAELQQARALLLQQLLLLLLLMLLLCAAKMHMPSSLHAVWSGSHRVASAAWLSRH